MWLEMNELYITLSLVYCISEQNYNLKPLMTELGSHMLNCYVTLQCLLRNNPNHPMDCPSIPSNIDTFWKIVVMAQDKKFILKTYPLIEEAGVLIWEFTIVLNLFLGDGALSL